MYDRYEVGKYLYFTGTVFVIIKSYLLVIIIFAVMNKTITIYYIIGTTLFFFLINETDNYKYI